MEIPGMRTGYVTGRVVVTVNDSDDPNERFDTITPSGWIYLTPRADRYAAGNPRLIVFPDRLSLPVDAQGYVTAPDANGNPTGVRRIEVPVAPGMTWQITGDITIPPYPWQENVTRNRVVVHPFDVPIHADETTDLADYLPVGVSTDGSTVWTQGEEGKPGRDGANVLPTEDAIAQAIRQEGVARIALDAVIEQRAVTSPSVERIVTSTDPTAVLAEGEILLVYQGPRTWTENFNDGLIGTTPRWNRRGDWDAGVGEIIIPSIPGSPSSARKALSLDALGDNEVDVELLAELTPTSTHSTFHHGLVMQGSGTAGNETGWIVGWQGTDLNVGQFTNGSFTSHYRSTPRMQAGVAQMVRARIDNGRIMVRSWPSAASEPGEWHVQMDVIGGSRPGWYGLAASSNIAQQWERVAVATQGGTAVLS